MRSYLILASLVLFPQTLAPAQSPTSSNSPLATQSAGSTPWKEEIDGLVRDAIAAGDLPGAVIGLWKDGQWKLRSVYGHRSLDPNSEPMTEDTIFDMASITKPVSTATSIWLLVQQGKIDIDVPVKTYLPDFTGDGRDEVLVRHLLTHSAGLIPDNALGDYKLGSEEAWRRLMKMDIKSPPGTKFVYSDVGFLLLGKIVEVVSGMPQDQFTKKHIFDPLKMRDSGYVPSSSLIGRIAPTEPEEGKMIRGRVHDPRAALLQGVAGHAGLFSTLDDLAQYGRMMLNHGKVDGQTFLSSEIIFRMTRPRGVELRKETGWIYRSCGWDSKSPYSYNGGTRLSDHAFGHGGFTGTVFWIDPDKNLFFVFLSNRLHPDGKGSVNQLAGKIASIAIGALEGNSPAPVVAPEQRDKPRPVLAGIDVLASSNFKHLIGKRVGLVTNQTGIDRNGKTTLALLSEAPNVKLVALFSPEHGIEGKLDVNKIGDSKDDRLNIPVFSLYGDTRKPKPEQLAEVDVLVYDIQDIGTRFYTYIATMKNCLQACSEQKKEFLILDRPNPIGGRIDGFGRDAERETFVACHNLPLQHGMTVGELAQLFRREGKLDVSLTVIPVRNWSRNQLGYETGHWWVNPSPNMRTLEAALLYPGVGMLEMTNLSVGRGTDRPFQWMGAPWLNGQALAEWINLQSLPGVKAIPRKMTPDSSKYAEKECSGVQFVLEDIGQFESVRLGLALAEGLSKLHPNEWESEKLDVLLVNKEITAKIRSGMAYQDLLPILEKERQAFQARRASVSLYD